jgi:DHA1 family tetracycline resistance protein-like MFS transporter
LLVTDRHFQIVKSSNFQINKTFLPKRQLQTNMAKPSQSAALRFIFITIFIDVLGLGIIIPVLPKLIDALGHAKDDSLYNAWLTIDYATMQFFFSTFLGNLSDRYGRRPVLLISLFGFGIDYLVMAFAPTIIWLFVGRTISGIAGASRSTATAYIADVSTGSRRAANFGLVGAASAIGLIFGFAIGAYLAGVNLRLPFMVASAFAICNGLYGLFVLPESLAPEHRRKFEWKRANPIVALIRIYKNQPTLAMLLVGTGLVYTGQKAVEYLLSFFLYKKFDWTPASVGTLGITIGLFLVAIQGGLLRYTIPKFGQQKNIVAGLIFYAVGLTLIAIVGKGWMMYFAVIPYCLGGISGPAMQSFASAKVGKNEQGELQGAFATLDSLSLIVGPFVFSYIFYYFTKPHSSVYFPGAPYLAAAALMIISTFITIRSFKIKKARAAV